jgi:hypothetical protein
MGIIKLSDGVKVEYHIPSPYKNQQDAVFYTGMGCIATITCAGYAVDVYCEGETRANLLTEDGQVATTLHTPKDFIDAGLDTDEALELANAQELIEWVNNSWFDLYCYGEHLDAVHHELIEALTASIAYVEGQRDTEHAIYKELDSFQEK